MRQHNLLAPVSVLITGLAVMILLLLRPEANTSAALNAQNATAYPQPTEAPYVGPSNNTDPTSASTATTTAGTTITSTPARTTTARTATPTTRAATGRTPTSFATTRPSSTEQSTTQTTTTFEETPTGTAESDSNLLTCTPGETVTITGQGPARAGFLLYFNERPVSGGTVSADGRFTIGLRVGDEAPGIYNVEVRIRGTKNVLLAVSCQVPAITPTPLPRPQ
jgi:hypothetical protein